MPIQIYSSQAMHKDLPEAGGCTGLGASLCFGRGAVTSPAATPKIALVQDDTAP